MTIPYGPKFMYLWPPRPQTTIKPHSSHFEAMKQRKNFRAQLKMNGQRNEIVIDPDGKMEWWNRHQGPHLTYNPPQWLQDEVRTVLTGTKGHWIWIDGELLNNKDADKEVKHKLYWWDVLVLRDEYLIGTEYDFRHNALLETCTAPIREDDGLFYLTDNIWVAKNILPENYDKMWELTEKSYVEGYVFKHTKGLLKPCIGEHSNSEWMVRCRKTTGRHRF